MLVVNEDYDSIGSSISYSSQVSLLKHKPLTSKMNTVITWYTIATGLTNGTATSAANRPSSEKPSKETLMAKAEWSRSGD